MSMPVPDEIEEENKEEGGKLIEVPIVEYADFKEKVSAQIKKVIEALVANVQAGNSNLSNDTVLALVKTSVIGAQTVGRQGEPLPPQKPLIEMTEQQHVDQRTAIYDSVKALTTNSLQNGQSCEVIEKAFNRYEFDVKLRELGFLQMMQLGQ